MTPRCDLRLVVAQVVPHGAMGSLSIGDAVEHVGTLPSNSVDFVLFSPPYDGVRDYRGNWAIDLPALGSALLRVVKDGGFAVIVIADGTKNQRKSMTTFRTAVAWRTPAGPCSSHVIYARAGRPGAWWATRFRVDHEHILMFYKGKRPRTVDHHAACACRASTPARSGPARSA